MEVICIEDKAFFELINEVCERLKVLHGSPLNKWVNAEEAMLLLNVKSRTTLQNLRDEGKIRYTQPHKKIILYERDSINLYLEKHAHNTF